MAGVKEGSVQVQFQGLETGPGPNGLGSNLFLKSLDLSNSVLDECIVAYLMNGEPLPMLKASLSAWLSPDISLHIGRSA